MTKAISPRSRKVRVLATLGPASNTAEMIEKLFEAGADAFRINMSHGDQASKVPVFEAIRSLEKKYGRPTTILADLQGPKLRVGKFAEGKVVLATGQEFTSTAIRRRATRPASSCPTARSSKRRTRCAAAARRRQDGAARHRFPREGPDHARRGRRHAVQFEGAQRPRHGAADGGAHREGPQRPLLRGRAGRRLDRACRSSSAPRI
jgi:hypothetical protein